MSFKDALQVCGTALCAMTACASAFCDEPQQNFILLVPHSLPAAIVDPMIAPTLTRLRAEGVYFIDSHTDLPAHVEAGRYMSNARSLTLVATNSYSTALIEDVPDVPGSSSAEVSHARRQANLDHVLHVLLPRFKRAGRPFLLVYRLGTPEGLAPPDENSAPTEDEEGPPAAMFEVLALDDTLAALESALKSQDLFDRTNIMVAAEHGSSTVWKDSATSVSREFVHKGLRRNSLPPGVLGIDIVDALQKVDGALSLFDPDNANKLVAYASGEFPARGNAVIAVDPMDPFATIEARGGYDLIYLPASLPMVEARRRAQLIADEVFSQDYFGGLFVDEAKVGRMDGALSIEHLGWDDTFAKKPTMLVNFVSVSNDGCDRPMLCTLLIADTPLTEGREIQSALNRAETWNFIAARGPAFRTRFVNELPASNSDVVMTLAHLMHVDIGAERHRNARLLAESLRGHEEKRAPRKRKKAVASKASPIGEVAEARLQLLARAKYLDAGGLGGWTVGIPPRPEPIEWRPWRWDWPKPNGFSINVTP